MAHCFIWAHYSDERRNTDSLTTCLHCLLQNDTRIERLTKGFSVMLSYVAIHYSYVTTVNIVGHLIAKLSYKTWQDIYWRAGRLMKLSCGK